VVHPARNKTLSFPREGTRLLGGIWAVFLAQAFVGGAEFARLGVVPRSVSGLAGVACMPFIHLSVGHLLLCTVSLIPLMFLLPFAHPLWRRILLADWLLSGILLWLLGSAPGYVGAGAIVFALIGTLIVIGWFRRQLLLFAGAGVVAACYALPFLAAMLHLRWLDVVWEPSLYGLLAGACVGAVFAVVRARGGSESHA
jgi:hypothetical protein